MCFCIRELTVPIVYFNLYSVNKIIIRLFPHDLKGLLPQFCNFIIFDNLAKLFLFVFYINTTVYNTHVFDNID